MENAKNWFLFRRPIKIFWLRQRSQLIEDYMNQKFCPVTYFCTLIAINRSYKNFVKKIMVNLLHYTTVELS